MILVPTQAPGVRTARFVATTRGSRFGRRGDQGGGKPRTVLVRWTCDGMNWKSGGISDVKGPLGTSTRRFSTRSDCSVDQGTWENLEHEKN